MENRPKFLKHCGNLIELRVEQIGPDLWCTSIYHGWLLAVPGVSPWSVELAYEKADAERAWMGSVEAVSRLFPPPGGDADKEWRDLSDMPDEDWRRYLFGCGFPGYPSGKGVERWSGF